MEVQSQFIEMSKHKKPNGKIADLVDANIKSVKKSFNKEDMIEYIDISSVNAKYRTLNETTQYIVASAPSRAQQCVQNGDILVSTVRPINRNVAVVNSNLTNLVASTGFCVLRPIDGYMEYLLAIVTSDKYTEKMCDIASGGLYPAVNNSDVLSYDIFIPDKDFLHRVTQIYQQADKSKFVGFKSQFIEMFGDNVSKKKISDVCVVRGGSTPTRTTKEFWNNGTISWFTVEDIYEQGRYISETKQHITELATKKCFVYPVDTVLICCTASVGEYAITKKEMASNQQFNGLMIKDKSELHPEYLLYVASTLKEDLLRQAGKTTINFVSRSKLEDIEIPVPPYSEQLGFVSVYQQADKSKYYYQIA